MDNLLKYCKTPKNQLINKGAILQISVVIAFVDTLQRSKNIEHLTWIFNDVPENDFTPIYKSTDGKSQNSPT